MAPPPSSHFHSDQDLEHYDKGRPRFGVISDVEARLMEGVSSDDLLSEIPRSPRSQTTSSIAFAPSSDQSPTSSINSPVQIESPPVSPNLSCRRLKTKLKLAEDEPSVSSRQAAGSPICSSDSDWSPPTDCEEGRPRFGEITDVEAGLMKGVLVDDLLSELPYKSVALPAKTPSSIVFSESAKLSSTKCSIDGDVRAGYRRFKAIPRWMEATQLSCLATTSSGSYLSDKCKVLDANVIVSGASSLMRCLKTTRHLFSIEDFFQHDPMGSVLESVGLQSSKSSPHQLDLHDHWDCGTCSSAPMQGGDWMLHRDKVQNSKESTTTQFVKQESIVKFSTSDGVRTAVSSQQQSGTDGKMTSDTEVQILDGGCQDWLLATASPSEKVVVDLSETQQSVKEIQEIRKRFGTNETVSTGVDDTHSRFWSSEGTWDNLSEPGSPKKV